MIFVTKCIGYIEEINIKSDAKRMKNYNISTIIIALYYCKLLAKAYNNIKQK